MTTPIDLEVLDGDPAARVSYPIAFALRGDEGDATLVITDDPAEQHVHLTITNTSGVRLRLGAVTGPAGAAAYHFDLRFRPGVLTAASLAALSLADRAGWTASAPQTQPDGTVAVFLLGPADLTFPADGAIALQLGQVGADGTGGARGVQVELHYSNLFYDDGTELSGVKLIHVDLVNQLGQRNVPLHAGFVGPRTVLNDGRTVNELTLRLSNDSPADLQISGEDAAAPTRFIVSFDSGDVWGLADRAQLSAASIDAVDGAGLEDDWRLQPGRQLGDGLAWTLTHRKAAGVLAAGEAILIRLGNIVTGRPSGDSNIYLRYENLPGYWDGTFVFTVEKSPIGYDAHGHVGIGSPSRRTLQVGPEPGGLGIDAGDTGPHLNFGDGSGRVLRIGRADGTDQPAVVAVADTGGLGVGTDQVTEPLTVEADSTGGREARQVIVRANRAAHLDGNGRPTHDLELAIGMRTDRQEATLQAVHQTVTVLPIQLNPFGGNVGIGLDRAPEATLEVNGGIRSPMWQAGAVVDRVTELPAAASLVTGGGTLLLFVSGAGYRSAAGLIGLQLAVGNEYRWVSNTTAVPQQRIPLSTTFVVTGLAAGTHPLVLDAHPDAGRDDAGRSLMRTDGCEYTVVVLELPF
jgi:hypothetical protein